MLEVSYANKQWSKKTNEPVIQYLQSPIAGYLECFGEWSIGYQGPGKNIIFLIVNRYLWFIVHQKPPLEIFVLKDEDKELISKLIRWSSSCLILQQFLYSILVAICKIRHYSTYM